MELSSNKKLNIKNMSWKAKIEKNDILNLCGNLTQKDIDHFFLHGNSLEIIKKFPDGFIDCVITSPPYWALREYKIHKKDAGVVIGDEIDPQLYISNLVGFFSELKRALKDTGSIWLNLGDKYNNKKLMGLPWRVAIGMQDDGWILRNDIIWDKMKGTQSAKDRMRDSYEHLFHFVKKSKYYYDDKSVRIIPSLNPYERSGQMVSATGVTGIKYRKQIKESTLLTDSQKESATRALEDTIGKLRTGEIVDFRMTIRGYQRTYHSDREKMSGRAKDLAKNGFYLITMKSSGFLPSDIWRIVPEDKWRKDTHYAVFPEELLRIPIKATCPKDGVVLDPFCGTGSAIVAAVKLGRKGVGIDLSKYYLSICKKRMPTKKPPQ